MRILSIFLTLMVLIAGLLSCAQPIAEDPVQYNLTVSSSDGGSVITPGEDTFAYERETVVDLAATADDGYRFLNWTGDVDTIADVEAASTTITMNGDYEIIANFEETHELTASSTQGGSVTTPGEGVFTYEAGADVSLVASPASGHRFVNWTGDVDTIADVEAASTTIALDGNYSITANFVAQYVLTIASTEGGEVANPGEGAFTYDAGTVVDLVAVAEDRHGFAKWTGDISDVIDVSSASTHIVVNGDCSVTAGFGIGISDWYDLHAIRDDLGGSYVLMNDLDSNTAGYLQLAGQAANGGKGWEPIGDHDWEKEDFWNSAQAFGGTLYGQGFEIRNLFINRPSEREVGLFGFVRVGGIIQDVGVVSFTVSGGDLVAGLVGWSFGTIQNSHAIGIVTGNLAGGLVAYHHGTVINSYYDYDNVRINGHHIITIGALYSDDFQQWLSNGKTLSVDEELAQEDGYHLIGSVSDFKRLLAFGQDASLKFRLTQDLDLGNHPNFYIPYLAAEFDGNGHKIANLRLDFGANMGGAIGLFGFLARGGQVNRVGVESVNIIGDAVYVGGLVGCNWWGTISECYSTGSINQGGGLVGVSWGTVSNCYSTVSVGGWGGGLVAGNALEGVVRNCYSVGSLACEYGDCGLVGSNRGAVLDSFWNTQTSGQAGSAGGTGKGTTEMRCLVTFVDTGTLGLDEPWDIVAVAVGETDPAYIWNIVDGETYPFLSWQSVS